MSYYRNFDGRRYHKTLASMGRKQALIKAKQYRKRGLLARVSPDPDHKGYYAVYICSRRKK